MLFSIQANVNAVANALSLLITYLGRLFYGRVAHGWESLEWWKELYSDEEIRAPRNYDYDDDDDDDDDEKGQLTVMKRVLLHESQDSPKPCGSRSSLLLNCTATLHCTTTACTTLYCTVVHIWVFKEMNYNVLCITVLYCMHIWVFEPRETVFSQNHPLSSSQPLALSRSLNFQKIFIGSPRFSTSHFWRCVFSQKIFFCFWISKAIKQGGGGVVGV